MAGFGLALDRAWAPMVNAGAGQPVDDIREVSNYVDAMMHGLDRLSSLPLSLRLIREMHERLLRRGRGGTKMPGEFRTTQNWIGGTRPGNAIYVLPPVAEMTQCLDQFERFIHDDTLNLPTLIKAGLLHVQADRRFAEDGSQPHRGGERSSRVGSAGARGHADPALHFRSCRKSHDRPDDADGERRVGRPDEDGSRGGDHRQTAWPGIRLPPVPRSPP